MFRLRNSNCRKLISDSTGLLAPTSDDKRISWDLSWLFIVDITHEFCINLCRILLINQKQFSKITSVSSFSRLEVEFSMILTSEKCLASVKDLLMKLLSLKIWSSDNYQFIHIRASRYLLAMLHNKHYYEHLVDLWKSVCFQLLI